MFIYQRHAIGKFNKYLLLMMPFLTGTRLERVGVVGLDQDCQWAELEDVGSFGLW